MDGRLRYSWMTMEAAAEDTAGWMKLSGLWPLLNKVTRHKSSQASQSIIHLDTQRGILHCHGLLMLCATLSSMHNSFYLLYNLQEGSVKQIE